MAHVRESAVVPAGIDRVFDLIADSRIARTWLEGFDSFEHAGGPERGKGAQVRARGQFLGMPVETILEIVEYVPPHRLVSESTSPVRSRTAWELGPADNGTTVTFVGDYQLPLALRMVGDRVLEQVVADQTRRSLENLKRLCQVGASPDERC
jgi:carbon monoxide dehydrogenase subunit G